MGNACDNEYLTVSYVGATLFLVILGVIFDRKNFGTTFKYGLLYGGGAGVFNGINNLLIMLTYSYLPISIISPVKSGLGMVLSFFISVLFYKEKFTIQQYISIGLGVVAVVLMNL
jgi:multidrug transporter EmrE-like cation transporter